MAASSGTSSWRGRSRLGACSLGQQALSHSLSRAGSTSLAFKSWAAGESPGELARSGCPSPTPGQGTADTRMPHRGPPGWRGVVCLPGLPSSSLCSVQEQLLDQVRKTQERCRQPLFVFDEAEKLHPALLEALGSHLERQAPENHRAEPPRTIFLFLW